MFDSIECFAEIKCDDVDIGMVSYLKISSPLYRRIRHVREYFTVRFFSYIRAEN